MRNNIVLPGTAGNICFNTGIGFVIGTGTGAVPAKIVYAQHPYRLVAAARYQVVIGSIHAATLFTGSKSATYTYYNSAGDKNDL
jgi:hypothetical protein